MSKNVFNVLQQNSDDEIDLEKKEPKMTKKELRKNDQLLREAQGDVVSKEVQNVKAKGKKVKDVPMQGKQRTFERHSGTGRQAFGNNVKKGGHGKGNLGKEELDFEEEVSEQSEDDDQNDEDFNENGQKNKKIRKPKKKKVKLTDNDFPKID